MASRMSRKRRLAYLSLLPPLPLFPYMLWRLWVGGSPSSLLYVLTALAVFGACIGLLFLNRRRSLYALLIPSVVVGASLAIWWGSYVHGRSLAIGVCQDAIDNPFGDYVQVLRQIAGYSEPTCAVGALVRERWFVRIDAEDVVIGSMWIALDDDDDMQVERVELEALRATQTDDRGRAR